MKKGEQRTVPPEVVERLLAAAGPDLVLIGGQSLAIWMGRFSVAMPDGFDYVSKDVDFLARSVKDRASVRRLAETLGGYTVFPSERQAAFTSLVGQAVLNVTDEEVYNVDVLHKMWGADKSVVDRALLFEIGDVRFRVLHPLDVLKSRLDNLHGLPEKQTPLGRAQLVAAIAVAREFLKEASRNDAATSARPVALRYVGFIEKLAVASAGKKVAERHGIHVADAIEPDVIANKAFREKKLPQLAKLMSPARRKELSLPA